MQTLTITMQGMTCNHCVMAVKKELAKLTGISVKDVQINKAQIEIPEETISVEAVKQAIENAGYEVVSIEITD